MFMSAVHGLPVAGFEGQDRLVQPSTLSAPEPSSLDREQVPSLPHMCETYQRQGLYTTTLKKIARDLDNITIRETCHKSS